MTIEYGSLYAADLNPRFGTEPGKVRPVLVIQTNLLNDAEHPSTLICSLTTKIRKEVDYLRVHLKKGTAGLTEDSDVMIDQIRAIDNRRFSKKIGSLSNKLMEQVQERLRLVMEL